MSQAATYVANRYFLPQFTKAATQVATETLTKVTGDVAKFAGPTCAGFARSNSGSKLIPSSPSKAAAKMLEKAQEINPTKVALFSDLSAKVLLGKHYNDLQALEGGNITGDDIRVNRTDDQHTQEQAMPPLIGFTLGLIYDI